ncbi:alpha-amylase family glycosyl hydrolase [Ktedonospora formicarum]|uniref:Alpha-amylase n=1 Tax=Ktedonospora formicarum TaxID=2778364 RepID=A0A8J3I4C6_9CHLR|nr:alpha-amylase family glycosyl hydrolase [Ktedonospora formicarum]GHO46733.1 alpha-amylase [Ktedonospora formicarum]
MPQHHPWWQTSTIYQIYPRSFHDSNGDGVGDIPGIVSKLDYLTWLGVDALWLSPIYPSPMADFGYDISDYTNVHPLFGSLTDMDALIQQAHQRNLKVILDFVPNHTSDEHSWFQMSRSSRDNPKRDWYIWRDPAPDGGPPTNWASTFGGPAWQFDELTGQYYLHLFDVKQPDLNWRNPEVRQAMYDVLHFWLKRGIDGFRIDVLWLLLKDDQFRDNPPNPDWKPGDPPYATQRDIYTADQPGIHDIVREMRATLDEYSERVMIGEIYLPVHRLVRYYGEHLDEAHLPFNFQLVSMPTWEAQAVQQIVETYEAALPAGAWPNWVLGNHDQSRIASRIGREQARVAQMLLLTLRGSPTCYYGDELGMSNVKIPVELIHDPQGKDNPQYSRDPYRTPMQWDTGSNAGFGPSGTTPWLPVADDSQNYNVSVEQEDSKSFLTLVRSLLSLRRTLPALTIGELRIIAQSNPNCFVYLRQNGDQHYLVALNFSGEEQLVALPEQGTGRVLLSTSLDREGEHSLSELRLRANEGLLIELP